MWGGSPAVIHLRLNGWLNLQEGGEGLSDLMAFEDLSMT
jgi:hypothetical protein